MRIPVARRMDGVERTLIRRIFDSAPADAINLGLGQPDLPTPPALCLAGVGGIAAGRTGYTSTAGDPRLRAAIAAALPGGGGDPDGVLVTIGSQEAMFAACLALLDPGDDLLVPDPAYPAYPVVARLLGARAVPYRLDPRRGFRAEARAIRDALTERTRAVVLCHPSNPTGAAILRDDLREITALLAERGIPWLSDEIYSAFDYEGVWGSPREIDPEGGLVISGLSKDLSMTGWRVGWVAGPPETVARVVAAHQYMVTCASSVSQCAALAAFGEEGRRARDRYRELFARRRELMAEELLRIPGLRFDLPDGAFYFFVDVREHGSSLEIARRVLERRNVVTIPGEAFGDGGAGFLRLSFACDEDGIREGVRRIAAELAQG